MILSFFQEIRKKNIADHKNFVQFAQKCDKNHSSMTGKQGKYFAIYLFSSLRRQRYDGEECEMKMNDMVVQNDNYRMFSTDTGRPFIVHFEVIRSMRAKEVGVQRVLKILEKFVRNWVFYDILCYLNDDQEHYLNDDQEAYFQQEIRTLMPIIRFWLKKLSPRKSFPGNVLVESSFDLCKKKLLRCLNEVYYTNSYICKFIHSLAKTLKKMENEDD